jgi:hypothetical protein
MIVQLPNLNTILNRHGVHPKFWPGFRAFVEEGVQPGKELQTRLDHVANYRAARREIIAELSKGLDHKFPPADYQSPVSYESLRYEEIEPEDTVLVTSAGAPSAAR